MRTPQQLVVDFFPAIAAGNLPDDMVTTDMTFWSVNSGVSDKARFHAGVKALASIFGGTLTYVIDSLTAEENRVVAEIRSHGTLADGEFHNTHLFMFYFRDGLIAEAKEYMDQLVVRERIIPLMQALMGKV